jgi:hypothetical protein
VKANFNLSQLKEDDSGVAFGLFLFLFIVAIAVLSYATLKPIWDGVSVDGAFDDEYKLQYSSPEDLDTLEWLTSLYEGGIILTLSILAAAVMVINRSIYRGS